MLQSRSNVLFSLLSFSYIFSSLFLFYFLFSLSRIFSLLWAKMFMFSFRSGPSWIDRNEEPERADAALRGDQWLWWVQGGVRQSKNGNDESRARDAILVSSEKRFFERFPCINTHFCRFLWIYSITFHRQALLLNAKRRSRKKTKRRSIADCTTSSHWLDCRSCCSSFSTTNAKWKQYEKKPKYV